MSTSTAQPRPSEAVRRAIRAAFAAGDALRATLHVPPPGAGLGALIEARAFRSAWRERCANLRDVVHDHLAKAESTLKTWRRDIDGLQAVVKHLDTGARLPDDLPAEMTLSARCLSGTAEAVVLVRDLGPMLKDADVAHAAAAQEALRSRSAAAVLIAHASHDHAKACGADASTVAALERVHKVARGSHLALARERAASKASNRRRAA